jgi:hypothetical protein
MAKQAVGSIERHLEKGVLGLGGLVLIGVIAMYLVMSPNKVQLATESVGPDEIYPQVAQQAEHARTTILNAEPPDVTLRNPVPRIRKTISSPLAAADLASTIRSPVPFLPPVPNVGPTLSTPDKIELAKFLPPTRIQVLKGRSVANVVPPETLGPEGPEGGGSTGEELRATFNWVTISGVYDRREQERLCRQAGYHPRRLEHPVVGVDLQRRERRWDGSYTEWKDVQPYSPVRPPEVPNVKVEETHSGLTVSTEDREAVRIFSEAVRQNENRLQLMRPLFPKPLAGDPWQVPQYEGLDLAKMDEEYDGSESRYVESTGETKQKKSVAERCEEYIRAGEEAIASWKKYPLAQAMPLLERARANLQGLLDFKKDELTQAQIERLQGQVNRVLAELNIARGMRDRGEDTGGKGVPEEPAAPQKRSPVQIVWTHDALTDSVASGRSYQYRMRLRFYNRYCGVPNDLKNPVEAAKVIVVGDWSEPSPEVTIDPDTVFFLASANPQRAQVKAEIYKWVEGEWVKQQFPIEVGQPIAGTKRIKIEDQTIPVTFDTGATVVDIDFDRSYRPVKPAGREGGLTVARTLSKTVGVVYLDPTGNLQERLLDVDKSSEERKEYRRKAAS